MPTNLDYEKLCRRSFNRLGKKSKDRLRLTNFRSWWQFPDSGAKGNTFFVSRVSDLSDEATKKARTSPGARYLLFSEGMPVESLAARLARLDIRDERRLHLAREQGEDAVGEVIYRLLRGISQAQSRAFVVDAWIEGENLVVLSPSFDRLAVPLDKLSPFLGSDTQQVASFEIDEDGSFLYWKHADVHLGWEQLHQLVNPAAAFAAKQKTTDFNRRYGAVIRALRKEHGLSQASIDGLTARHLRRIELGQQPATKASLEALAASHAMDLSAYMNELAGRVR